MYGLESCVTRQFKGQQSLFRFKYINLNILYWRLFQLQILLKVNASQKKSTFTFIFMDLWVKCLVLEPANFKYFDEISEKFAVKKGHLIVFTLHVQFSVLQQDIIPWSSASQLLRTRVFTLDTRHSLTVSQPDCQVQVETVTS